VNFDLRRMKKSQIGKEILTYLVEHPDAHDTVEGIVEWWLMERQIKFQTVRVKEALSELVAKELILKHNGTDAHTHYRINQRKYEEIKKLSGIKDED
jgi:Fe2+ or Zn2+ uptake regulation protein